MKVKTLFKIILSGLFCITFQVQANGTMEYRQSTSKINTSYASYTRMSTEELQVAMEELSLNGEYPLEMGVELMKRWTTESYLVTPVLSSNA